MQTNRSMEDMKQRFYNSCNELNTLRETGAELLCYDAEHEKRRKEQLIKLWNRTQLEVSYEIRLVSRRLFIRRLKRNRC